MPATLVNMPRLIIIERFLDAMYIKRITWLSLLCAAILCLSSCGSAGTLPGKTDSAAEAADSASYRYVKTAIALPKENFIISNTEAAKSNIYLFGTEVTEAPNNYYIYALDYDGNIIDQKRCAWDDGYYHSIMDSAVDDSGTIWLLEYLYERSYDEDGNKTSERFAGWCVERVDEGGFSGSLFSSSVVDEPWEIDVYNEAVYLCSSDGAFCFSVDGDFLGSSGSLNGFRGMTIAGGSIYLLHSDISGVKISLVSPEDCSISADLAADVNVYDLIGGTGLYINSGSDLYSFDPETGETGLVLNWVSAGVSGNYKGVTALADGAFLYYDARELCILEPAAHTDELITLTLASMEPRFIRDAVIDFNASNEKYAVEIIDYSQYNTDDAPEAGVLRLNLDIISGNAPDIIDLTSLPLGQYENMGLLEDLSAYFDREGSPAMAENLLNALKSGGKLCAIVPCCTIMTIEAYGSDVDGMGELEFHDILALQKTMGSGANPFGATMSKKSFLETMLSVGNSKYIDWKTGTCNFDSSFKDMLEFVASLPDEYDLSTDLQMIASRDQLLSVQHISSIMDILAFDYYFGGDLALCGIPSAENSGAVMCPYIMLGMSSAGENKDGVWEFMSMLLSDRYQDMYADMMLPTTEYGLEQVMDDMDEWISSGGELYLLDIHGNEVSVKSDNEKCAKLFRELLYSVTSVCEFNQELFDIVWPEAQAYFCGDKSVDEAVNIISSRVQIYVSEHL